MIHTLLTRGLLFGFQLFGVQLRGVQLRGVQLRGVQLRGVRLLPAENCRVASGSGAVQW